MPTQYPYSIKYTIATLVLLLIFILMCLNNVLRSNDTFGWLVFGVCLGLFVSVGGLLIFTRLIPALKGRIALELTEDCLIDYIRNITIDWQDIAEINLIRGRSSAIIRLDLKWESDYGEQIAIPLRWVKGKDAEIYDTVMAYFEQATEINKQ
ncbi:hypothetical protein [Mucilaginibacter sp.]|uniref:hypothetical protein n=1 Tax=Mucilaginibacter sp. TaxID=1882438 RepID=UPI003D0B145C